MIEKIKDELYRISKKMDAEKLFELSPVYLISNYSSDFCYLQYLLDDLQNDMEERNIIHLNSQILLCLSLAYDSQRIQYGFYDELGNFKSTLEQWISSISMRYHFDHGIILINIENLKEIEKNYLWWKQFFSDIRRYKKDFLFFISCYEPDMTALQNFLEKEIFVIRYELRSFTAQDYFDWCIVQLEKYSVKLDKEGETVLKNLFVKYEQDINYHLLELWIKSLLWSYYTSNHTDKILPLQYLSENTLIKIMDNCKKYEILSKIGFM